MSSQICLWLKVQYYLSTQRPIIDSQKAHFNRKLQPLPAATLPLVSSDNSKAVVALNSPENENLAGKLRRSRSSADTNSEKLLQR
ncbi:hypothetical protein P8452_39684 [Trifolium repens]|nr:hypothetical protein P8452_39684 [Trifolium repens]